MAIDPTSQPIGAAGTSSRSRRLARAQRALKRRIPEPVRRSARKTRSFWLKRGRRSTALVELVIPLAVVAALETGAEVAHWNPRTTAGKVFLHVIIVLGPFLAARAITLWALNPMLAVVLRIAATAYDADQPFLFGVAAERLEETSLMLDGLKSEVGYRVVDPGQMEGFFQHFFSNGKSPYIGIDTHPPTEFVEANAWYLRAHEGALDSRLRRGLRSGDHDHRILVLPAGALSDDYLNDPELYLRFMEWHSKSHVRLSWVDRAVADGVADEVGLPTVEVGCWHNQIVLFTTTEDAMHISLPKPGSPLFQKAQDYVRRIEDAAQAFPDGPPGLDLVEPKVAARWQSYVGPERRLDPNGRIVQFLRRELRADDRDAPHGGVVLDAAAGIGCEFVSLTREGYAIWGNEADARFGQILKSFVKDYGVLEPQLTHYMWEQIPERLPGGWHLDAVLVLGNSLCLVSQPPRRAECLTNFLEVLKPGGLIIIDERNFQTILDRREDFLSSPPAAASWIRGPGLMYSGETVRGCPVAIEDEAIAWTIFEHGPDVHSLSDVRRHRIGEDPMRLYPFKYGELYQMLVEVGFTEIQLFADLEPTEIPRGLPPRTTQVEEAEFFTYVAQKPH